MVITSIEVKASLWKRLAWFFGLWAVSVAAVGTVAYVLRWWIHA